MEKPFTAKPWDDRFSSPEYVFGTEPSVFLQEQLHHLCAASRVLVPADGEGRNSVFLAEQGHSVVATDISREGIAKAQSLAQARGVQIEHHLVDLHDWEWPDAAYDAVVAIFIQFSPPELRRGVFAGLRRAVRPGGVLMLHGYTPRQLEYGTGGPPRVEHLYTEALMREAFGDWEVLRLASYERELAEGHGHQGMSALMDLVVRRPTVP